ncbi:MAG: retrotransposon gag domain-containing protein, partial [Amphritea sp.]|nr:retrotransposon gag domain-containing protein [Amphritea sp.]
QRRNAPASSSTFNIGIKPKDPPYFNGRANEDVDTWLAKVGDFLYLTEANNRQQVAYTATLLQEAAADWWMSLLRERHGVRPVDFPELSGLLQKRFGSSTRADRARADLRNIKQAQSETVRSYSTRFEALLAKLPSFDAEWAKTQFIWGLHQRVAELVVIAKPSDLAAAINQAEHIEMARNFASGNIPSQKAGIPFRGRGGFMRGRGRFNAVQTAGSST